MDRTTVIEQLTRFICQDILHNPTYPLQENEPLISGGLIDSRSLVHIAVFIEDTLGVYIPDTDFTVEKMDTIEMMTNRIMEEV
ncbi:hypothetical protein GF339_12710 [candidate division KSB3 bacterium]|uniref:Carrier domain-containing protein n=1 Tax=candidate division KSB3 bacterium TaxID=2044937 RepID=A0A9D5JWI4_9BACT|nr:hypothetical protein [candidate division KSB3 bacterium]MBD3325444.1 hypothetical protein [candidate division KSB3 bacterium]